MLGLFQKAEPRPEEIIGPDGMTDFSREMKRQRDRRDAAMSKIYEALSERTGIDADLVPHLPYETMTLAVLLGIKI